MPVDTVAKRMAVANYGAPLGTGVYPGSTGTALGRSAAVWGYYPEAFVPPAGGDGTGMAGLGQKKTFSDQAELGGGGW